VSIAGTSIGASVDQRRFSGLGRLFGAGPAQAVRSAHVAVVGVGGVGSWAAEALARSGVCELTLIDMDHVSESNINRQLHALSETIGQSKIEAMAQRIQQINPDCKVHLVDDFVTAENWPEVLGSDVDALIDACDQIRAKTAMAAWARRQKKWFISVGAAGGKRLAHLVDIADLSACTHDPLLARLRYRLRKEHGAPKEGKNMGVACVFSKEAVQGPDASCGLSGDGSLNCHGYGSLVSVTATFGMCAAGWVIDKLSSKFASTSKNAL
jgi:tRNA A37 threonylcarbamoyladenosine dehydratase